MVIPRGTEEISQGRVRGMTMFQRREWAMLSHVGFDPGGEEDIVKAISIIGFGDKA